MMSAPEGKTDVPREPGHFRFWPETVITMQRTAVSQVDYGRKLRIGGMSCLSSKFLQRFL
jgi:hypothetical protein